MTTLGEQLKQQQLARQQAAQDKSAAADRAAQLKLQEQEQEVRAFGQRLQNHIILAIENNQPIKGLRVPRTDAFDTYRWKDNFNLMVNHPFSYAFADVQQWAADNGLEITLTYEHDGMGMQSWYTASARPL